MSTVRANNYLNADGTYGTKTDSLYGSLITVDGWEFIDNGGSLYPKSRTKVAYNATGGDQTFIVPAGKTQVFVKLWGAGGGNGRAGGWSYGADGGGGGHTRGLLSVTPGETLIVKVGVGGMTAVNATSYGGGGGTNGSGDVTYAGQGGGGSYIFRSTTPLLIAGGGGGGGSSRAWTGNVGGAGGGITGQKGESPYDGKPQFGGGGGTQSGGGTGGGTSGSLYQGGVSSVNSYGGGGGGGYYGGAGGGYSESNTMGGGGGGSGYVVPTAKLAGTFTGDFRSPAMSFDNDLNANGSSATTLVAHGAQGLQNNIGTGVQTGGNGYVVIYY